jgi:hypothetical protein
MPINANGLTYTAAQLKLILLIDGTPHLLVTANDVSLNTKQEVETGYAIGQEEPIINKKNAKAYTGKISLRIGELGLILLAHGYTTAVDINNASLGITSYDGVFHRVYSGLNVTSEDIDVKAKDKDIIVPMSWEAVTVV